MWIFNSDNWIEIWETIRSNRMRSILTAFGVFWGIFILLIMLGSSNGLESGLRKNFEGVATNSAFMWSQTSSKPYKGYNAGRRWEINNNDMKGIRALMSNVKLLAPRINHWNQSSGDNVVYGDLKGDYTIFGDYPDYFKIIPVAITMGRTINIRDIQENRKICVIGDKIQEELFKGSNPLGKNLRIDGVYFKVIGVMHPKSPINIGGSIEDMICIPFTTLQKAFGYGDRIDFFCVTAKDGVPVSKVEKKVKQYLLKQHSLAPDDYKAVGGFNMQNQFNQVNGLFIGLSALSWIVGLGTLIAGIIGVSNIMLIVIKERTKEIGIKRALGAQSRFIRGQILFESALLTLFAGFTGLFFSVVILELVSVISSEMTKDAFIQFAPSVNIITALSALTILLIGGIFAGLLPANKAIRIKPIDALRDE